ncbi:predicted protein [Sclerotinia sclerotiorum 1980 UF-70]|uniref:Uncharacterized protein n=1 Tax=Sclerotinia sclerotiorum (strain ATCC 18683 / 1980 / Ss-1) TaxID=665079 RepID=A7F5D6_SCLS1|nr:predicted protein [Sclerotinia sclerotiorum 1980 UF-70]EDN97957.1 predicted protein [Sclerotinia sclerotiorum 1980 UF-70]
MTSRRELLCKYYVYKKIASSSVNWSHHHHRLNYLLIIVLITLEIEIELMITLPRAK